MTALLLLSVFYAALAFSDLEFLSARGRIGPGFFPQIIAVLLVAFVLYNIVLDYRRRDGDEAVSENWRVTLSVVAMVGLLIVASHFLGALPGMVIFMLLALSVLNRGRHVTNLLVGLLLPIGLFTLFRYSLNAAMPPGLLGLPL
ncbi:MAG: tripartite tricarboxylate transporter TctB family protein [Rhodospirillales bacterium]